MSLPLPVLVESAIRLSLLYAGASRVCRPRTDAGATLQLAPEDNASPAGPSYYRRKLTKSLAFVGNDFLFLLGVEMSQGRCTPIGLLLETRPNPYANWIHEEQFVFSCNEISWDLDKCTATVTPTTDDGYRLLLENYDTEYNVLSTPVARQTVSAKLATLSAGITIEFIRVGIEEQTDYLGTDGWVGFLQNHSWIQGSITQKGHYETNNILFRYRLRHVRMDKATRPDGSTYYVAVDKSGDGWSALYDEDQGYDPVNGYIDYVKEPSIAGFKAYKIGTYNDWNDPRNGDRYSIYGDQLLLIDANSTPHDYGYDNGAYIEVTGPDGGYPTGGGGANNAECQGRTLNVRRDLDDDQCSRLFWRFGDFSFLRCFPLLDAIYGLLKQTATPIGRLDLLPPTSALLSQFYSQDVNQATGETGAANELPRLVVAAASDVKRYGASEPASRLMLSLKQALSDLQALHQAGWFIDPATGWLRIEHRAYFEQVHAIGDELDLTSYEQAQLPKSYTYRTQQLPRYEELTVANASTQDLTSNLFYDAASIDYGLTACVNGREGQNKTTLTSARLTGDITAMVLNGDNVPDNALAILAPDADGRLSGANRQLAANMLLLRYHTYGAALVGGMVNGQLLNVRSLRPSREQASCTVGMCSLNGLGGTTRLTTNLGSGGQIGKAELDLLTGKTTFTPWLPLPTYLADAPVLPSRTYSDAFSDDDFR